MAGQQAPGEWECGTALPEKGCHPTTLRTWLLGWGRFYDPWKWDSVWVSFEDEGGSIILIYPDLPYQESPQLQGGVIWGEMGGVREMGVLLDTPGVAPPVASNFALERKASHCDPGKDK